MLVNLLIWVEIILSHALSTFVSSIHQIPNADSLQWQRGSCILECLCRQIFTWETWTKSIVDWHHWPDRWLRLYKLQKNWQLVVFLLIWKKKKKRSASKLLHVYLSLQQHGGPSVTWPNSAYWWLWTAAIQLCVGGHRTVGSSLHWSYSATLLC